MKIMKGKLKEWINTCNGCGNWRVKVKGKYSKFKGKKYIKEKSDENENTK